MVTYLLDSPRLRTCRRRKKLRLCFRRCSTARRSSTSTAAQSASGPRTGVPGAFPPLATSCGHRSGAVQLIIVVLGGCRRAEITAPCPPSPGAVRQPNRRSRPLRRTSWAIRQRRTPLPIRRQLADHRHVPTYGTQAHRPFEMSPGGRWTRRLRPQPAGVLAALAAMIQAGDRKIADFDAAPIRKRRRMPAPRGGDAMPAAYLPGDRGQRRTEPTRKFSRAASLYSAGGGRCIVAGGSYTFGGRRVWATPAGRSLVYRGPSPLPESSFALQ